MRIPMLAFMLVATPVAAFAQQQPANPKPDTPAVQTRETPAPAQPAKGANSFTEEQARSRFTEAGFTNVTGLSKDKDGIWRGKGMKNGAEHAIALDYQGHVFPK